MKKKAVTILLTAVLALQGVSAPVCRAAASESSAQAAASEDSAQAASESSAQTAASEDSAQAASESSAQTAASEENSILEKGSQIGEDLYRKMDEAIDSVDKKSLRRTVREALEKMDEMGISPTAVAENALGIKTTYSGREKAPENTLIRDAQNAVQKKTDGFFSMLWDGFLDTLENMIMSGLSIFGGREDTGAATGGNK